MTTGTDAVMQTGEVRALLSTFRPAAGSPSEATVVAWQHALVGCTFGECQAALLALGMSNARTATPEQIVARIKSARTQRVAESVPHRGRRDQAERTEYARAGARGIQRVYAAMGWRANPDRVLAEQVACPFCHAPAGRMCRPLSRDRAGRRERRDTVTLTHPSRLRRARTEHATEHASGHVAAGGER